MLLASGPREQQLTALSLGGSPSNFWHKGQAGSCWAALPEGQTPLGVPQLSPRPTGPACYPGSVFAAAVGARSAFSASLGMLMKEALGTLSTRPGLAKMLLTADLTWPGCLHIWLRTVLLSRVPVRRNKCHPDGAEVGVWRGSRRTKANRYLVSPMWRKVW